MAIISLTAVKGPTWGRWVLLPLHCYSLTITLVFGVTTNLALI